MSYPPQVLVVVGSDMGKQIWSGVALVTLLAIVSDAPKILVKIARESGAREASKVGSVLRITDGPDAKVISNTSQAMPITNFGDEAYVRKLFFKSEKGKAQLLRTIGEQEIQILGIDGRIIKIEISKLPASERDKLIGLFNKIVTELPYKSFEGADTLEKAMRERLEKHLAESPQQASPRYKFDVSSGKLTLPKLGRVGSVEINGGELDTYKLLKRIALLVLACIVVEDCKKNLISYGKDATRGLRPSPRTAE